VRALVAQAVRAAQIDVTLGVLTMRRLDGRFTWIAKTATKEGDLGRRMGLVFMTSCSERKAPDR